MYVDIFKGLLDEDPEKPKATPEEERRHLREAGFIHVTGLRAIRRWNKKNISSYIIGENIPMEHLGRYDINNGMMVIITLDGEVWLAALRGNEETTKKMFAVANQICPNGRGAAVPCSNWEAIDFFDLMARVANPDYQPIYFYSSSPSL